MVHPSFPLPLRDSAGFTPASRLTTARERQHLHGSSLSDRPPACSNYGATRLEQAGPSKIWGILKNVVQCSNSVRETMPKLKTHSGAAKRFKKTGTGKIKRGQSKMRHILTSKESKTKRKLGKSSYVSDGDHAKVSRMIPYA